MNERKVTRYECDCVLVAIVQRNDQGFKVAPHAPLSCPVHGRIWACAYTVSADSTHEALESAEEKTGAAL